MTLSQFLGEKTTTQIVAGDENADSDEGVRFSILISTKKAKAHKSK
jgi:hypothetical protein